LKSFQLIKNVEHFLSRLQLNINLPDVRKELQRYISEKSAGTGDPIPHFQAV